jgi:hypothetical protein
MSIEDKKIELMFFFPEMDEAEAEEKAEEWEYGWMNLCNENQGIDAGDDGDE